MPALAINDKLRARFTALAPAGCDVDELRALEVTAQALPDDMQLTAQEQTVIANVTKQAGAPMINRDGRPTILRVVAWICHGDVVNRNGDMFVKEELQAMAPGLFREPNFGVMDWNHSAVHDMEDDPEVIGVWYGVEYAYNQAAGAWGLLAKGMAFAWLFPKQTDSLVAEQLRSGTAKFSMACIPKSVEFKNGAAVLHNPVFFTVSALDKPPADPNAVGKLSEDPTTESAELIQQLNSLPAAVATAGVCVATAETVPAQNQQKESIMNPEEIIAQLKADKTAAEAKLAEIAGTSAALEAKLKVAEAKVAETEAGSETLAAEIAALKTKLAELETSMTEAASAREGLAAELKAAQEQIATLEADKAALAEKLAVFEAKEAELAAQAKLASRKAELPETYLKAHSARKDEDRSKVEVRWASMTDEQWTEHKDELLVGFTPKANYVARSAAEGQLPSSTSGEDSPMARVARHIKR